MPLLAESVLQVGGNSYVVIGLLILAILFVLCFPRAKVS